MKLRSYLWIGGVLAVGSGCKSMDRFGTKLEAGASHIAEGREHVYEGKLVAIQAVGAMTVLEFEDGKIYNVESAHPELKPGDIIRIYKVPKGLEARLWKSRESQPTEIKP
jgi:hypothetical protein